VIHPQDGRETRIVPEPTTMLEEHDALIVMGTIERIRELGGTV
jgi:K+/H+ antiporter YhaU regulatory subunit KhtT